MSNLKLAATLLFLSMLFFNPCYSRQAQITPAQIGDTLRLQNVSVSNFGSNKINFPEDFKHKAVILDFWATWCSPCVASIPALNSLQKRFGTSLQIIQVSMESKEKVTAFLKQMNKRNTSDYYNLPQITADTMVLNSRFPHNAIPFYVWIGPSGIIRGFSERVTEEEVAMFVKDETSVVFPKLYYQEKVPLDIYKPFLFNGNGGKGGNVLYHSVLTSYTEGIGHGSAIIRDPVNGSKILIRNNSLYGVFSKAYSEKGRIFDSSNMIFEIKDTSNFKSDLFGTPYVNWLKSGSGYCYEISVPPALNKNIHKMMQQDLARLFPQYTASIRRQKMECLILKRTSAKDKLKSKGEKPLTDTQNPFGYTLRNVSLGAWIFQMNTLKRSKWFIVDETGYNQKVDLVTKSTISNLPALNKDLKKYDLELVAGIREFDYLVISDTEI